LNYLLGRLVESTGLSGTDRLLGGVFGAARGLALIVAVLLVAGFTPIPADPWWKDSQMVQRLMPFVVWSSGFLPENVSAYLEFDPQEQPVEEDTQEEAEEEGEKDEKTNEIDESNSEK
jgi:membrane protein required for colicin V production